MLGGVAPMVNDLLRKSYLMTLVKEDLGEVVDRLHRRKVMVNQATSTNVYTYVHNLHTLCCIPVCTLELGFPNSGLVR